MKRLLVAGFALLTSASLMAQSAADQLSTLLDKTNSYSAQFQQIVSHAQGQKGEKSSGKFELRHPGKFRWEVNKPYQQLLISTGKELWIYEPDIDSVTVNDLEQQLGATPALLLSSDRQSLINSFHINAKSANEYVLTPKDLGANFEKIELRFANGVLVELNLQDSLGSHTQVLFTDAKTNIKLNDARFQFTPPENADLIDNRRHKE